MLIPHGFPDFQGDRNLKFPFGVFMEEVNVSVQQKSILSLEKRSILNASLVQEVPFWLDLCLLVPKSLLGPKQAQSHCYRKGSSP